MSFVSLPFELVVRICRINAHYWQDLPSDTREPLQDTIAASQVCSRWRSIVLSTPELWRFAIDPYHPCVSWRDLVLKHSEPFSIEFKDDSHTSQQGRPVHDIQLQMQSGMHLRLRRYDMRLEFQAETIPNYLSAWPSEPGSWPQLRRLCLEFHIRDTEPQGHFTHRPGSLPVQFPGLATPILERLSLTSCYMADWNDLRTVGNTLTHLKICFPPSRLCPDRCIEILQNLPNLESLEFSAAFEMTCDHSHTGSRFTLGVKKFVFSELLPYCASFLDRINLSPKCRWSCITCHSHAKLEFEISEEEGAKVVLPHIKRFLSVLVTDTSRLRICDSMIMIDSSPLRADIFSRKPFKSVTTEYLNHFSVDFHRHGEDSTYDVHDRSRSFIFPALLDLIRPISTYVELAETHRHHAFSNDHLDHLIDFLIPCRNLRFMGNMSRQLWERLCERLIPAAGEVIGDTTEPLLPLLQTIDFDCNTGFKEKYPWGDVISFDELKAFCKHRARIRVPLRRIRFRFDGVFEMDSFGAIKLESLDSGKRA
ncbi:hypothetical protein AGABI2DRAFT_121398 [Agaricus bisporus var. bisporus H97]|uniref:hypothetical protein n=1 Tax=Agaricus bisporus var. bisporus (strain H97 / ATCC MYA-4626 / FGSC 10389) TaxID=936046 RepID=UPI00029F4FC2|nr:hypothetical protein AGABI2DRAFT_121398 [Agaricus bisporus var. bisporus H97]EKV44215.1 hypothetical protein AGABI2DRAFT_121398 [Agaricus bisporus var. bisporus H97]